MFIKINGIGFTGREIDIISCIINGRTAKSIGNLLNISSRTVSVHIANISRKIEGNSQEQIINFIESSNFYKYMRRHYVFILYVSKFRKLLLELSKSSKIENCYFYKISNSDFIEKTKQFIEILGGVVMDLTDIEGVKFKENDVLFMEYNNKTEAENLNVIKVFFSNSQVLKTKDNQLVCNEEEYFCSFLQLLEYIFKNKKISEISKEFCKSYKEKLTDTITTPKNNSILKYIVCGITFFLVSISFFIFKNKVDNLQISNITILENSKLLNRTKVINDIDRAIHSKIGLAVITGEGGAGKTIVARKYLKTVKNTIVWEINAESKENILKSLMKLAAILISEEDLKFISAISQTELKISKLLNSLSKVLQHTNWIFLYDNVNNLYDITRYFPSVSQDKQKIIITTRNANVKDIHFLENKNIINIGVLDKTEKNELFYKILGNRFVKESSNDLINQIPSLPLDICAAAYYIKETGDSYKHYLNFMKTSDIGFYQNQKKLLENNLNYGKTRYSIIVSSLRMFLNQNKAYKKLLFLLCMLNPKDILKEYFEGISDSFLLNQFIYDLKKYSIINDINKVISIHEVNQDISLSYITKVLTEKEIKDFLEKIITNLCSYQKIAWFLYEGKKPELSVIKVRDLYTHFISILSNIEKLPISENCKIKFRIKILLAIMHASKYIKSEKEIIDLAQHIIELNEKHSVLNKLDKAVLFEIYGSKNIYRDIEIAEKYLKKCLTLCEETNNTRCLKAICLADYAKLLVLRKDIKGSKIYLSEALNILIPSDCFWKAQARVTVFNRYQACLSGYYVATDELKKVIQEGKDLLNEIQTKKFFYKLDSYNHDKDLSIFMIRRNIAAVYNRLGKVKEALTNIKEAEASLKNFSKREHPILKHESTLAIDYGCILLRSGNLKEAIKIFTKAMNEKEKISDYRRTLYGYLFRSEALIQLEKYKEAEKDCMKIMERKKTFMSNAGKCLHAMCLYNLAVIKLNFNDKNQSLKYLHEFLEIMKEICSLILKKDIYKEMQKDRVFVLSNDLMQCFEQSKVILSAIYNPNHPYIKNYVSLFPDKMK